MGRFALTVSLVAAGFFVGCDGLAPSPQTGGADVVTSDIVTSPVKIDCGSNAAVAPFAADNSFKGGTPISHANTIDLSKVAGGAPAAVYQTARTGNVTYALLGFASQVSAKVRLHFAETYFDVAGKRTFDISINGAVVQSGFDIITASGGKNVAFIYEKTVNADANGTVTITFKSVVNNSLISAIEVIPAATCTAGQPCTPGGNVCQTGTTSCATGTATCTAAGNVANGTACGGGKVCSNGACVACTAGAACTPANLCHGGTISCATGMATCTDTGAIVPNGTACGGGKVCSNGACVACTAGAACTPTNACHRGSVSCATGTATCTDTGTNVANGTACGGGKVCSNGACTASCTAGAACTPANVCQTGAVSCASGTAVCTATGNVANGTVCGSGKICTGGSCVPRPNGMSCGAGTDCGSGNCSEGVCCDTSCGGTCRSCLNANTGLATGTCGNVKVGLAHASDCSASAASSCGNNGKCDGAGGCQKYASGTVCAGESCTAGTSTYSPMSTCNGAGTCVPATQSCGNFKCTSDGVRCAVSCTGDTSCSTTGFCQVNTCVAKLAPSTVCARPEQCSSSLCGGRCCNPGVPCTCTQPSAANLVKDPNFDDTVISHAWSSADNALVTRSTVDQEGCPFSGAALIDGNTSYQFAQCVNLPANTTRIDLGLYYKRDQAASMGCGYQIYDVANCDSNGATSQQSGDFASLAWPDGSDWTELSSLNNVPFNFTARSVYLQCGGGNGKVWVDHVFVTTNGTKF